MSHWTTVAARYGPLLVMDRRHPFKVFPIQVMDREGDVTDLLLKIQPERDSWCTMVEENLARAEGSVEKSSISSRYCTNTTLGS